MHSWDQRSRRADLLNFRSIRPSRFRIADRIWSRKSRQCQPGVTPKNSVARMLRLDELRFIHGLAKDTLFFRARSKKHGVSPGRLTTPGRLQCIISVMAARARQRTILQRCLVVFLLGISRLGAIDPHQPIIQMYHSVWTAREGVTGQVESLAQTADGFLWLGTTNGLLRFDGVLFERYKPESGSFASVSVTALLATPDGGLWIGYTNGGASFLNRGRVYNYSETEGMATGQVRSFAQDADGTIWAATVGGLARFDGHGWRYINKNWNPLNLPIKSPSTVAADRMGNLWTCGWNEGVFVLPRGGDRFEKVAPGPVPDDVRTFVDTGDGFIRLWVPQTLSLLRLPVRVPDGKRPQASFANSAGIFLADRDGSAWLATADSIWRVPDVKRFQGRVSANDPSLEKFTPADGLTSGDILTMLEDREGSVWVATSAGLERFRQRNAVTTRLQSSATDGIDLVAGDQGAVWASSPTILKDSRNGKQVPGSPADIRFAFKDPDGAIWYWAGHDTSGALWRWDQGKFAKRALPYNKPVRALTRDGAGDLWLSIMGTGVFRQDRGAWSLVELLKGEPDMTAYAAANDREGRVWFSYPERKKVARWDGGSIEVFSRENGLSIGAVSVLVESGREMWAGGDAGVGFFRDDTFHSVEPTGSAEFGEVSGILVTPRHGVWLTVGGGIVNIPQTEVQLVLQDSHHKVEYQTFDLVTDLDQPLEDPPFKAAAMGADGILWFATHSGVVRINPAHLHRNSLPPPVAIRTVMANGKTYSAHTDDVLPPHTTNVRIGYSVLSLAVPERVRSRYRLSGSDREWQEAGSRGEARYDNLGPGRYTLEVTASNNDGVWNGRGASLSFTIQPAFYQTAWFQLLYVLAGALLIWLFYRMRLRQVTGRVRLRYNERLAERTRIARELHDTLLQSFQASLIQMQAARDLFSRRPEQAAQNLDDAITMAAGAIAEGRGAIQELRSQPAVEDDLAKVLTMTGQDLARSQESKEGPVSFRVGVEGERQALKPLLQDEVSRIARELLRNAFQHAQAAQIEAEIRYDPHLFRVHVRDDGKGIDAEILKAGGRDGHWGLAGMRERAKRIGARLDFWSEAGAGTEVQLSVPGSIVYQTNHKESRSWLLRRKRARS